MKTKKVLITVLMLFLVICINVNAADMTYDDYINTGLAYEKQLDYKNAITNFTKAISLKSTYYAYFDRGYCYFEINDLKSAIVDYTSAIKLIPKDTTLSNMWLYEDAYFNRASAYYNLKDYINALKDIDVYLFIDSDNAQAFANRALSYANLGFNKYAIDDCNQALSIDAKNETANKLINILNATTSKAVTNTNTKDNTSVTDSDTIESQIDGTFEGWTGETIFKLTNGQIWQQSSYAYTYHYAYKPKVLIYKDGSVYKMKVDGVDKTISVKKIK